MKLSNKRLQTLIHGAYRFIDHKGGYMSFCHYDEEQTRYLEFNSFFYDRAFFNGGITIEFITDATAFSFDYKFLMISSPDSIDVFVDDLPYAMRYVQDMGKKGSVSFTLPEGKKKVTVYLSIDADMAIKNFRIEGKWRSVAKRRTKVLWIGDSITQGFGGFIASYTYVNVANRILKYEILNQGIGGYYYDVGVLKALENFQPDKIILAMGTNQYHTSNKKEVIDAYYQKLIELYPDTPILALTPIWRELAEENKPAFKECADIIRAQAEKYPNVTVVDGLDLLPHCLPFYKDGLHPNALGMTLYGENLAKAIQKLGW